jgi:glucose/arabinose dehydrogenase
MKQKSHVIAFGFAIICGLAGFALHAIGASNTNVLTGSAAFTDYRKEAPGVMRKITVADLPQPFATKGVGNGPKIVARPEGMWPLVPPGFKIDLVATGLGNPRELRTAPNGDLFLANTHFGEIKIFRGMTADSKPVQTSTFATGLHEPFGIAFYPLGPNPQYVYIANINSVVRFPYKNGDLTASGPSETLISGIPTGGHSTRDLAFSPDGKHLFVSVGSGSNIDDPDTHPSEFRRANILEYTPDGKFVKVYASGIRNPVGIAIQPETGQLWCSVNERDMLGDNLVPDYITHVQEDGFYGWPFYYMGSNPDPRLNGKHPELKGKVIVPDILLQPHNASLEMTFYEATQFGPEYKGDIFASEHGSWNKADRAGYEVIMAPVKGGKATGEYEDFVTGFVTPSGDAWGRPVGVAVAPDGSLMVTDDASESLWRVHRAN